MARVFRVKAVVISLLLTTVIAAAFRNPNYPVQDLRNFNEQSVVSVQRFIRFEKEHLHRRWDHICEGNVVTRRLVLTACRCMMGKKYPPKLRYPACYTRVEAGNYNLATYNKFRQVRRVEKFLPHPECGLDTIGGQDQWHHDVGLLLLQFDLKLNQEIIPIHLYSGDLANAAASQTELQESEAHCTTSGWRLNTIFRRVRDPHNPDSDKPRLRKNFRIHLIPAYSCKQKLCASSQELCTRFDAYQPICATRLGSICNEDSGGPLFCNGYLYGTLSNRTQCNTLTPLTFTSIQPILELINKYEPKYEKKQFKPMSGYVVCVNKKRRRRRRRRLNE